MALHTELPIYKVAYDLFDISTDLAKNMPRDFKASIGGKLRDECVDIVTLIFRANVAQDKTPHLDKLIERVQVIELMLRLSRDKRLILTIAFIRAHHPAVAEKEATGGDSPSGAAMSRTAFAMRLFCRLGAPSFGRAGRGSRKARRCSTGLSTLPGSALPFDSGWRFFNRNWSNLMCTQASPATGTTVTPPVDLDELSQLASRCQSLALGLQLIVSSSVLPDGQERDGLCYELASLIEESAERAHRLAAALM